MRAQPSCSQSARGPAEIEDCRVVGADPVRRASRRRRFAAIARACGGEWRRACERHTHGRGLGDVGLPR